MAENNGTGSITATPEVTNRVPPDTSEPKVKGKSSRASRLDALWRKGEDHSFSLSGEADGQKYTLKTEGFPKSLNSRDVVKHFRESGADASRKATVGSGKASGKTTMSGEVAADTAEVLIEETV